MAEAARIQPSYGPDPTVPSDEGVSSDYAITSILVSGASFATLGLNLIAPNRSTGWAGLLAGSVGVIAGAANLDQTGATANVAAANLIIGSGAIVAGLYRLLLVHLPVRGLGCRSNPLALMGTLRSAPR